MMQRPDDEPELDFSAGQAGPAIVGDRHEDEEYRSIDFSPLPLAEHSFEDCVFDSCRFREMNLSGTAFFSCLFRDCEIVLAKLGNATLNGARFESCKIVGVNFSDCVDFAFSPSFEGCAMDSAVLYGKALRKAKLIDCRLMNCDFTECDFREADFSGSSFENVVFHNCNLEKADFRTAVGYAIDPSTNKIRNARFALPEAQSFLSFLGIRIER